MTEKDRVQITTDLYVWIVERVEDINAIDRKLVVEDLISRLIDKYNMNNVPFFPDNQIALQNVAHRIMDRLHVEHTQPWINHMVDVMRESLREGFYDYPVCRGDYQGHLPFPKEEDRGEATKKDVRPV